MCTVQVGRGGTDMSELISQLATKKKKKNYEPLEKQHTRHTYVSEALLVQRGSNNKERACICTIDNM